MCFNYSFFKNFTSKCLTFCQIRECWSLQKRLLDSSSFHIAKWMASILSLKWYTIKNTESSHSKPDACSNRSIVAIATMSNENLITAEYYCTSRADYSKCWLAKVDILHSYAINMDNYAVVGVAWSLKVNNHLQRLGKQTKLRSLQPSPSKVVCHYANEKDQSKCFVRSTVHYVKNIVAAYYLISLCKPNPNQWYSSPVGHNTLNQTVSCWCWLGAVADPEGGGALAPPPRHATTKIWKKLICGQGFTWVKYGTAKDQDNSDSDIRQYFKRSKEVLIDIGKSYMENGRVSVYSIGYWIVSQLAVW